MQRKKREKKGKRREKRKKILSNRVENCQLTFPCQLVQFSFDLTPVPVYLHSHILPR